MSVGRRTTDVSGLRAPVVGLLGYAHMLQDPHVELTPEYVRQVASQMIDEAERLEEALGGSLAGGVKERGPRDDADVAELLRGVERQLLNVESAADALGIVCEAVHDLGGWTEPANGIIDALTIDLGDDLLPVVHASADPGSQAAERLQLHLPGILEQARRAAQLAERNQLLKHVDIESLTHDPLTGLFDAQALDRILEYSTARHTVVLVHLDELGNLVQDQGRAVGDLVVRRLATLLVEQVRVVDYVFRRREDEFVILAHTPEVTGGRVLMDRLRRVWEEHRPRSLELSAAIAEVRGRTGPAALEAARMAVGEHLLDLGSTDLLPGPD